MKLYLLDDHLYGKPGNVGDFDSCQGNVGEASFKKKSCQGKVA